MTSKSKTATSFNPHKTATSRFCHLYRGRVSPMVPRGVLRQSVTMRNRRELMTMMPFGRFFSSQSRKRCEVLPARVNVKQI
jgi:hypothetical protein